MLIVRRRCSKVELQMEREVEEEKKVFIVICFDGIVSTLYFCCCFFFIPTENKEPKTTR